MKTKNMWPLSMIRKAVGALTKRTSQNAIWARMIGLIDGLRSNASGQTVNERTALNLLAFYAGVRAIAETMLQAPMFTMQRMTTENGGETTSKARAHPTFELLHNMANPTLEAGAFRQTLMGHVLTYGNGYAEIERDVSGRPIALWVLSPANIVDIKLIDQQLHYLHRDINGRMTDLSGSDVFHLAGLGFDGVRGYSPVTMARNAIGAGMAADEFSGKWFANGATPSAILTHPGHLEKPGRENIKRTWEDAHSGTDNAHKIAVMEEGMTLVPYGMSPEDSQLLATRRFTTEDMARLLRIPPPKIGDLTRATFSNIEQLAIWYITDTIDPWAKRFEMQAANKLFTAVERQRFFPFIQLAALLRGDLPTRYAAYATGRQWGWLSVNDIRGLEELNNIGEAGDVYLSPLNMINSDELLEGEPPPTDAEGASRMVARILKKLVDHERCGADNRLEVVSHGESCDCGCRSDRKALTPIQTRSIASRQKLARANKRLFDDAAARSVTREVKAVSGALGKLDAPDGRGAFVDWMDKWYPGHDDYVRNRFSPVIATFAEQIGIDIADERAVDEPDELSPKMERFASDYTAGLAGRYVNSSRGQLIGLLDEADAIPDPVPDADGNVAVKVTAGVLIGARLAEWQSKRADKLSTRENAQSLQALTRQSYTNVGVTRFRWVTFGSETCPICEELDGQIVGVEGSFARAGDDLEGDADQSTITRTSNMFHPPAHDGCVCQVVAD